jgi:SNF2 family DNA or RNA helicase
MNLISKFKCTCAKFQVSLLNIVVELKKCCNHPFLFESADHGYGGDSGGSDNSKLERIVFKRIRWFFNMGHAMCPKGTY